MSWGEIITTNADTRPDNDIFGADPTFTTKNIIINLAAIALGAWLGIRYSKKRK